MKYCFLVIAFLFAARNHGQVPGANVFGSNQVITVRLNFNQPAFWDSLVANYSSETDMVCASLEITDNQGVHTFSNINIRLKGNSSYGHPGNKKSFKIDFNDNVPGQNYDGLKKLNFNNGFKDPTFMREKVFFELSNICGAPAPRVNYANVYMNNVFWGFYELVEQVDDQFLDWAILNDTGNLFKAGDNFGGGNNAADLMNYGTNPSAYYSRYELKTNETANDWTDLVELIQFINTSSTQTFANEFGNKINKTPYLRSLALDVLFSNLDSYLNSARNYYIYHNLGTTKWEWIKWDGNEAFGVYSGGPGTGNLEQLAINYVAASRPLISNIFSNSILYEDYKTELCFILKNYFTNAYLDPKINELKNLISAHVYADNGKMYSNAQFDQNIEQNITGGGGPGGGTIYGLKSFIANRNAYISGQLSCVGTFVEEVENEGGNFVYPNPFSDFIQLHEDTELYTIWDARGLKLHSNSKPISGAMIHLGFLPAGFYMIECKSNQKVRRQIIVKASN